MKQALIPCAAVLLAVPQVARAQAEPLCDMLDAYAAAQWSEPNTPAPRYWVEFHWGAPANSTRWVWGCTYSDDDASERFCDWLVANTSQTFHMGLPLNLLGCMGEGTEQRGAATLLLEGKVRRQAQDGSWLVLESISDPLKPSASAVRISFDSDDGKLDPGQLPPLRPYDPDAEQAEPVTTQ